MPSDDVTPVPDTAVPRPRVLLVEDEPSVRLLARLILERGGFSVEEAATAVEAVRRAERAEAPFAVVVLDYTLPDRDAVTVLPDLRRAAPRARIILTSGQAVENLPPHGAEGFLPKPFSREQLLAAVRAAAALSPN